MASQTATALAAISALDEDDILLVVEDGTAKKVTVGQLRQAMTDPILKMFGTPTTDYDFNTSDLSAWTSWGGSGLADDAHTTVPGHYYLKCTNSGSGVAGRYVTAPAAPFTVIAKLSDFYRNSYGGVGLAVGVTSPGAIRLLLPTNAGMRVDSMTPTSFSSTLATNGEGSETMERYLAIVVNSSTDHDYYYSGGGMIWSALLLNHNFGAAVGTVGLGGNPEAAAGTAGAFDYMRIWNSALTFAQVSP